MRVRHYSPEESHYGGTDDCGRGSAIRKLWFVAITIRYHQVGFSKVALTSTQFLLCFRFRMTPFSSVYRATR